MTYTIKVAEFEGPFDLILFFIERDELDIYDIPINQLTNDFLEYIRKMEEMNIDLASEFILVAATLMRIKAKTLLPRKELDEQGQEIDPRAELVAKLLEYKKYKSVLSDLANMAENREMMHARKDQSNESASIYDSFETEMDLEALNLYKLLKVFNRVMQRMENRGKNEKIEHRVVVYPYTLAGQRGSLKNLCSVDREYGFEEIFESCREKMEAIFRLLALLELVQLQMFNLRLGNGVNSVWIERGDKYGKLLDENNKFIIEGIEPTEL